jgi:large conductance mechanosensitive channel
MFINTIITFLIVSFCIFLVVKGYNRMKESMEKKEEEAPAAPPEPSKEEVLLTEIRDLLKKQ